jgi:hypothetical protein
MKLWEYYDASERHFARLGGSLVFAVAMLPPRCLPACFRSSEPGNLRANCSPPP